MTQARREMPYQPTREESLLHRYRLAAVWLVGLVLIGYALRELWPVLFQNSGEDNLIASLVLSAGIAWLVCGLARCNSLMSERQKMAEILDSL
jgi:hypothetical protein